VAEYVPFGVFFTATLNSCGASGMVSWSKFQFPFVYAPFLTPDQREDILAEHTVSETVIMLTASSSAEERTYGMNNFGPFQGGVSYFAYALVKVLERHNGLITHSQLIEHISDY
jgi:hypothetical protein